MTSQIQITAMQVKSVKITTYQSKAVKVLLKRDQKVHRHINTVYED